MSDYTFEDNNGNTVYCDNCEVELRTDNLHALEAPYICESCHEEQNEEDNDERSICFICDKPINDNDDTHDGGSGVAHIVCYTEQEGLKICQWCYKLIKEEEQENQVTSISLGDDSYGHRDCMESNGDYIPENPLDKDNKNYYHKFRIQFLVGFYRNIELPLDHYSALVSVVEWSTAQKKLMLDNIFNIKMMKFIIETETKIGMLDQPEIAAVQLLKELLMEDKDVFHLGIHVSPGVNVQYYYAIFPDRMEIFYNEHTVLTPVRSELDYIGEIAKENMAKIVAGYELRDEMLKSQRLFDEIKEEELTCR